MPRSSFCISPEFAQQIAQKLVVEARKAASEASSATARLHHGRGQYRLDYLDRANLESVKRLLIEMTFEVDEILSAPSSGEVVRPSLQAAE